MLNEHRPALVTVLRYQKSARKCVASCEERNSVAVVVVAAFVFYPTTPRKFVTTSCCSDDVECGCWCQSLMRLWLRCWGCFASPNRALHMYVRIDSVKFSSRATLWHMVQSRYVCVLLGPSMASGRITSMGRTVVVVIAVGTVILFAYVQVNERCPLSVCGFTLV